MYVDMLFEHVSINIDWFGCEEMAVKKDVGVWKCQKWVKMVSFSGMCRKIGREIEKSKIYVFSGSLLSLKQDIKRDCRSFGKAW